MTNFHDFKGAAKRIDDIDIPRIGYRIRVGEDEMHALMDVEAAGSGFDDRGRPKMLFEPHLFYRFLGAGKKRDDAVAAGLAYKKWIPGNYPKDSYPRLEKAIAIDETVALRSASWGFCQMLGDNHLIAGYKTAQEMVKAFMADEEEHLEAMVNFIVSNRIDDDLREHRWDVVARVYNGPGYAKHGYHTRLAEAYQKWSKIKDTPWGENANYAEDKNFQTYPVIQIGSNGFVVTHLQQKLAEFNYHAGAIDGQFGAATRSSVLAFQADHDLTTDGIVGQETWMVIEHSARPKPVSRDRMDATTADLRAKGSNTIKNGDKAQVAGGVATATGAIAAAGEVAGAVEDASGALHHIQGALTEFSAFLTDYWPVILIVGGGVTVYYVAQMKRARVMDHKSGANMNR